MYGAVRQGVFGTPAPLPERMLPKDIEKTLRAMGDDGEKVRGTLERDFAAYVKKAEKDRRGLLSVAVLAMLRPMAARGLKRQEYLFSPSPEGYSTGLDEVRAKAGARLEAAWVRGTVDEAARSVPNGLPGRPRNVSTRSARPPREIPRTVADRHLIRR